VTGGKGIFMTEPHNYNSPISDLWRNSPVFCLSPDLTWGKGQFVYLWSSTKGSVSHIST